MLQHPLPRACTRIIPYWEIFKLHWQGVAARNIIVGTVITS